MSEEINKTTPAEPEETELSNQDLEQVAGGAGSTAAKTDHVIKSP